jgi:hypothetical protein
MGRSGLPYEEAGAVQDLRTEFDVVKTLLEEYIKKGS